MFCYEPRPCAMNNQISDNFKRSEFTDEIYAVLGRAITIAARFDASCKALARSPFVRIAIATKAALEESEFEELLSKIQGKYNNLNRAIDSLSLTGTADEIMTKARECRNELIHEAAVSSEIGFDHMEEENIQQFMLYLEILLLPIIRGDALVSAMISTSNDEELSNYPFSKEYESRYINWVMERF